jgi:hypothetical protein
MDNLHGGGLFFSHFVFYIRIAFKLNETQDFD